MKRKLIGVIILIIILLISYFCIYNKKCNNMFPFNYFVQEENIEEEYY